MKKLFTLLFIALLAFSAQSQCTINFNPTQVGDELQIVGQGVNQTITTTTAVTFDGNGNIIFTYSGADGSTFDYDCNGKSYSSGSMNNGFTYTETQALPVELIFFKGELIDNSVVLKWQTSSEENNSHFEVERSTNGIDFDLIGFVEGNGTTIEIQDYIYIDYEAVETNYYRLKQVDFDGNFEYSDIVYIEYTKESKATIFGNITETDLRITGEGEAYVVNSFGQVVKQFQLTESNIATIDVSMLAKGIYYVKLQKETLRFIKL